MYYYFNNMFQLWIPYLPQKENYIYCFVSDHFYLKLNLDQNTYHAIYIYH